MEKTKTALLVTFFTVLIWVLAEGESLQTKRTVADVSFPVGTSESFTIRVADGSAWPGGVELLVEGPTASLEGLEQVLRRPVTLEPGMPGVPRESGERSVDLREALRNHPEFRSRGVTVLSAEPSTVSVVIDELRTVSFPVRVEAPAEELDGPAQLVGIDRAEARVPARQIDAIPEGAGLVARVRSEDLVTLDEGVRSTLQVRLEPGPGLASATVLGIQPAQASVQVTVRTKTQTAVIPTLNIDVRGQLAALSAWDITLEPADLRNVEVTGPRELIAKLESGELVIRPFVWVPFDELAAGTLTKQVEFTDFGADPQALNLRFEVEDREVRVTIRPRQGPEGASAAGSPSPG